MSTRLEQRVVGKAASYTINATYDRSGTIFTNEGAVGAIVFTLPTPNAAQLGRSYEFVGVVDQTLTVTAPVADTLIVLNDLAADSLALSTASQKIGGSLKATCVRTGGTTYQWFVRSTADGALAVAVT